MKIKKVLPKLINFSLPITFILSSVPLNAGDTFDITIDAPTGSTASGSITFDTSIWDGELSINDIESLFITVDDTTYESFSDIRFEGPPSIDFDSDFMSDLEDFNVFSSDPSNGPYGYDYFTFSMDGLEGLLFGDNISTYIFSVFMYLLY